MMEFEEEKAISTAANPPRWWYRYVDDSHACLQKKYVQEFHDHLNSINPHIQFTKEVEENNCISFLDTAITRIHDRIQVSMYRKPTHTDKYLDFNSHHPAQHTRSVVNTLLEKAKNIPSTRAGQDNRELKQRRRQWQRKRHLETLSLFHLCYFAIISTRSIFTKTTNFPGTKLVGVAYKLRKKMKNLPSCVHVLHKTLNVAFSRCCFAEDGKEIYQKVKRTCRAIVFPH